MKKYKLSDLTANSSAYDRNFKKLLSAVNTPRHDYYVKIERELVKKGNAIRKALGKNQENVCPLQDRKGYCNACTGYFRVVSGAKTPKGKPIYQTKMVLPSETAELCVIKNI